MVANETSRTSAELQLRWNKFETKDDRETGNRNRVRKILKSVLVKTVCVILFACKFCEGHPVHLAESLNFSTCCDLS